jgi:hypothetical protein
METEGALAASLFSSLIHGPWSTIKTKKTKTELAPRGTSYRALTTAAHPQPFALFFSSQGRKERRPPFRRWSRRLPHPEGLVLVGGGEVAGSDARICIALV